MPRLIKTSDLAGAHLDWAVAISEGHQCRLGDHGLQFSEQGTSCWRPWRPSADWSQGGPIIERESIDIEHYRPHAEPKYCVARQDHPYRGDGRSALIAAMRCYVGSRFGAEVEVPEALA